jgi:hypothetical protein
MGGYTEQELREIQNNFWLDGGRRAQALGFQYAAKTVYRLIQEILRMQRVIREAEAKH